MYIYARNLDCNHLMNQPVYRLTIARAYVIFVLMFVKYTFAQNCACVTRTGGELNCTIFGNCGSDNFNTCRNFVSSPPLFTSTVQECPTVTGCNPYSYNTSTQSGGGGSCWYQGGGCGSTVVCNTVALPVRLVQFKVTDAGAENSIQWTTASELNNDYFILEFSSDGLVFEELVRLPGNGTTNEKIMYHAVHTDVPLSINYYRLIQVDFDGTAAEFGPVSVDNRNEKRMLIRCVNMLGQEVSEQSSGVVVRIYDDGSVEKRFQ